MQNDINQIKKKKRDLGKDMVFSYGKSVLLYKL